MQHARAKLIVAALAIVVAVGLLAYAGAQRGWVYYMEVDHFIADTQYHGQRVRLNGFVSQDELEIKSVDLMARFDLIGDNGRVPVVYQGVIPAMFKPGAQVVVEGQLDQGGVFQADTLMTKCASKYQAEEHDRVLKDLAEGRHGTPAETPR